MKYLLVGFILFGFTVRGSSQTPFFGGYATTVNVVLNPRATAIPIVPIFWKPVLVQYGSDLEISLYQKSKSGRWYKNGSPLEPSSRISFDSSGLRISGFVQSDVGYYGAEESDSVKVVSEKNHRLLNLSSRGFVNGIGSPMIVGTVIDSDKRNGILVRAIGPSLAKFGVENVLEDPVLDIVDSKGKEVSSSVTQLFPSYFESESEVGAFPIDRERGESSAVVVLENGAYTFVLRSKSGKSGNVLLEIYEVRRKID